MTVHACMQNSQSKTTLLYWESETTTATCNVKNNFMQYSSLDALSLTAPTSIIFLSLSISLLRLPFHQFAHQRMPELAVSAFPAGAWHLAFAMQTSPSPGTVLLQPYRSPPELRA